MERRILAATLGLLMAVGPACSKTDTPEAGQVKCGEHLTDAVHLTSGYEAGSKGSAVAQGKNETPDKVVDQFLKAAKAGDQQKLSLLMTTAAREETTKHSINFELDSYRDATFEIGGFEYLTPEKVSAHVACKWTDHDETGAFTHDVIWALRKEDLNWRIVGMITRPFPDQPPVAFNYENVDELMATKAGIEQEVKRRAEIEEREARRATRRERSEK